MKPKHLVILALLIGGGYLLFNKKKKPVGAGDQSQDSPTGGGGGGGTAVDPNARYVVPVSTYPVPQTVVIIRPTGKTYQSGHTATGGVAPSITGPVSTATPPATATVPTTTTAKMTAEGFYEY